MRRATVLRLLGGAAAAMLYGCDPDPCGNFPVPANAGDPAKPTAFGSTIYQQDDIGRALQLLAGCGSTLVRIGLDGSYNFPDVFLAAASRAGLRPILISPYAKQPVDVASYAEMCAAYQARYNKYNPIWEIWNEPNLAQYWGGKPDVDRYAQLAIPTAKALRQAGARDVWSGGTSGVDVTWAANLGVRGAFTVMNGCAVHTYMEPCGAYGEYVRLQNALPARIPIHTTETCIPSTQDQVSFLRQMWYVHRLLGMPTMIWCELRDGTAGADGPFAFPYGLVYPDYAKKASYFAAQSLIAAERRSMRLRSAKPSNTLD